MSRKCGGLSRISRRRREAWKRQKKKEEKRRIIQKLKGEIL